MATARDNGSAEAGGSTEAGELRDRLSVALDSGTPSERSIAHYLLSNLTALPFQTAAAVAMKVGVSEASVEIGRAHV